MNWLEQILIALVMGCVALEASLFLLIAIDMLETM
jgi:hypothetical protein